MNDESPKGKYLKKNAAPGRHLVSARMKPEEPSGKQLPEKQIQPERKSRQSAGRRKRRRKYYRRRMALLVLSLCLLLVSGLGAGLYIRQLNEASEDFQDLSNRLETQVSVTEPPETSLPTAETAAPGGTEGNVPETETLPSEAPTLQMLSKYSALYEQNQEFFGWIRIDDTRIDYPVMHSPSDPEKYLHANFDGEFSYPGTPLMDGKCTLDSTNYIVYGHNMQNGSMFRDLIRYRKKDFWQEHPTIYFDTLYEQGEYEILAAFYDRVYLRTETDVFKFYQFIDAENQQAFDEAIDQFKSKSLYDTGVSATYGDQLLTLVTCSYHTENGRFVVVARKVN